MPPASRPGSSPRAATATSASGKLAPHRTVAGRVAQRQPCPPSIGCREVSVQPFPIADLWRRSPVMKRKWVLVALAAPAALAAAGLISLSGRTPAGPAQPAPAGAEPRQAQLPVGQV